MTNFRVQTFAEFLAVDPVGSRAHKQYLETERREDKQKQRRLIAWQKYFDAHSKYSDQLAADFDLRSDIDDNEDKDIAACEAAYKELTEGDESWLD